MSNPCEGCAFSEGAAANLEVHNRLKGLICLLGPLPFHCHHLKDGTDIHADPKYHESMTREEFRKADMQICAGWKREVRELAATGYYRDNPLTRRGVAQAGLEHLKIFVGAEEGSEDKQDSHRILTRIMEWLGKKRRKFQAV
jgi:hypothetical protein